MLNLGKLKHQLSTVMSEKHKDNRLLKEKSKFHRTKFSGRIEETNKSMLVLHKAASRSTKAHLPNCNRHWLGGSSADFKVSKWQHLWYSGEDCVHVLALVL